MKKQITLAVLCLGLVMMQACKGPEGPAGPAGVGATGPAGAAGAAGAPGTANVFYSSWAAAGPWTGINFNSVQRSYIDIPVARITQDILDKGVVLVYADLKLGDTQIRQLPVTVKSGFTEELIDFSLALNTLRIWSTPFDGNAQPSATYQFRYVVIPGGQAIRMMNYENLSYEEAVKLFNIQD
ncbi:hypothetical protein [Dyadobacter sp. 3J3]|uniref:hypothetical protein n=1 Tax=Dyadobacter sp. 3J3 TaxID=2606600 RepID=UPI00190F7BD6|nr:hypothetical protein [Dyadobacter sp. 3J3]